MWTHKGEWLLRKGTRTTVYLNTAPPSERVRLLKSCQELEDLDDEDTNIDSSNILKRYSMRPAKLEKMCFAEWAAWFDEKQDENEEDLPLEVEDEEDTPNSRRKRSRIIRCPWFNVALHPDKHYRELVMLFIPWRDEEKDLLGGHNTS